MQTNERAYTEIPALLNEHNDQYDWLITEPTELDDIELLLYQDVLDLD
ncbi:hypothetical protein [Vibrio caribbeanicus]|nr:hypothetical protein [Vibrio caribbeanicus]MCY9843483.1 hypothetical protein [Vibrio caribbeanicus]